MEAFVLSSVGGKRSKNRHSPLALSPSRSHSFFAAPSTLHSPSYPTKQSQSQRGSTTATRLYSGLSNRRNNNKDDDDEEDSLFRKLAKQVLPKSLVPKSAAEKRRERERRERLDSVDAGLSTLLKDAPLPLRLMGKLVSPLLGNLAEQIQEQSRGANDVLNEARTILQNSPRARELLGNDEVDVGPPFAQSSSSSSINGQTSSVVRASFQVRSGNNAGTATVMAKNGVIETLQLSVGGRTVDIDTGSAADVYGANSSSRSTGTKTKFNKDDVIDAEFVEKN